MRALCAFTFSLQRSFSLVAAAAVMTTVASKQDPTFSRTSSSIHRIAFRRPRRTTTKESAAIAVRAVVSARPPVPEVPRAFAPRISPERCNTNGTARIRARPRRTAEAVRSALRAIRERCASRRPATRWRMLRSMRHQIHRRATPRRTRASTSRRNESRANGRTDDDCV